MGGNRKLAKPAGGRPLDGEVRPHQSVPAAWVLGSRAEGKIEMPGAWHLRFPNAWKELPKLHWLSGLWPDERAALDGLPSINSVYIGQPILQAIHGDWTSPLFGRDLVWSANPERDEDLFAALPDSDDAAARDPALGSVRAGGQCLWRLTFDERRARGCEAGFGTSAR